MRPQYWLPSSRLFREIAVISPINALILKASTSA